MGFQGYPRLISTQGVWGEGLGLATDGLNLGLLGGV